MVIINLKKEQGYEPALFILRYTVKLCKFVTICATFVMFITLEKQQIGVNYMTVKPNTESTIETLEIVQVTKNSTSPKPLGVLVRIVTNLFYIPVPYLTEATDLNLERYPVYFYDLPKEQQVLPPSQHFLADLTEHVPTVSKNHILVFLTDILISKGEYSTEINSKHIGYQLKQQKQTNNLT